jgi:hypothetical protein
MDRSVIVRLLLTVAAVAVEPALSVDSRVDTLPGASTQSAEIIAPGACDNSTFPTKLHQRQVCSACSSALHRTS